MHLPALPNLSNAWLASYHHNWVITGYNIFIIPTLAYFDRKNKGIGNKSQSRDKILYILLAFVFYPVMMVVS